MEAARPLTQQERVQRAREEIRELCAKAFADGVREGFKQGFEAGIKAATGLEAEVAGAPTHA